MKFVHLMVFFLVFWFFESKSFSNLSYLMGSAQKWVKQDSKTKIVTYMELYQEDGLWKVEQFKKRPYSMQERVKSLSFQNESEARGRVSMELSSKGWISTSTPVDSTRVLIDSDGVGDFFMDVATREINLQKGVEILTEDSSQYIWKTTQKWTWEKELEYSEWVKKEVQADFMQKNKIPTDCADLAFVARWIFAHSQGLPVAQQMAGSGDLFSNLSMKRAWSNLPTHKDWTKDKRFLAAIEYLMDNTYTHTLIKDSYPIAINPESFKPGVHHLQVRKVQGHTTFVYQTGPILKMYASNLPRIIRPLMDTLFFDHNQLKQEQGGFMRFRWPVLISGNGQSKIRLVESQKMPYYSLEQFEKEFLPSPQGNFALEVNKRLNSDFNPQRLVMDSIDDLVSQIKNRVEVVRNGYAQCKIQTCIEGTQRYEDWSTPERDNRIVEQSKQGWKLFENVKTMEADKGIELSKKIKEKMDNMYIDLNIDSVDMNGSNFSTFGIEKVSLYKLLFIFQNELFSSDPNRSIQERWGLGSKAIFSNIKNKIEFLYLTEREQRIQLRKTLCPKPDSCPAESESWVKTETFEIDHRIRSLFSIVSHGFCVEYPNNCQEFVDWANEHQILNRGMEELGDLLFQLNSDPKMDHVKLKPKHIQKIHWQTKEMIRSEDKKLFQGIPAGNSQDDFIIYSAINPSQFFNRALMSKKFNLFVQRSDSLTNSTFTIRNSDLQTFGKVVWPLLNASSGLKVFWSNGVRPILWFRTENELKGFQTDGSLLHTLQLKPPSPTTEIVQLSSMDPRYEWGWGSDGRLVVLDTETLEMKAIHWQPSHSVAMVSMDEKRLIFLKTENGTSPSLFLQNPTLSVGFYVFSTGDIQWFPLPQLTITQWIKAPLFVGKWAQDGKEYPIVAKLSQGSDDGSNSEIHGIQMIMKFESDQFLFWLGESLSVMGNDFQAYLFDSKTEQFQKVSPLEDEKNVYYVDSKYVFSNLINSKYRIRATTGKVLFESSQFQGYVKKDLANDRLMTLSQVNQNGYITTNVLLQGQSIPFYSSVMELMYVFLGSGQPTTLENKYYFPKMDSSFGWIPNIPTTHNGWLKLNEDKRAETYYWNPYILFGNHYVEF